MRRIILAFCSIMVCALWLSNTVTPYVPTLLAAPVQGAAIEFKAEFSPLQNIKQIAAGFSHTCALTGKISGTITGVGHIACWGDNDHGQLGDGTSISHRFPIEVKGLNKGVTQLVVGDAHTCILTDVGIVMCWGGNAYGQLGDGTTVDRASPVQVQGLQPDVVALTAGAYHTCATSSQRRVKCWGLNSSGQLGDGTTANKDHPVVVQALHNTVQTLVASGHHTCALTQAGRVLCWGNNTTGQLGDGTLISKSTPVESKLTRPVKSLAAGYSHTCALIEPRVDPGVDPGRVQCWGRNDYGQLGDGTNIGKQQPVDVHLDRDALNEEEGIVSLAAGIFHTCALTHRGSVHCWGANPSGQLGDGTTVNRNLPVAVHGLKNQVVNLITGYLHTCARSRNGNVECWGWNSYGQLGNGTSISSNRPVIVRSTS